MDLNFKFFHKSCITDRYFRGKRSMVYEALNNLVQRRLLNQSSNDRPFFSSGRVTNVKAYLKFLPGEDDEDRCRKDLLSYGVDYEEYKKNLIVPHYYQSTVN